MFEMARSVRINLGAMKMAATLTTAIDRLTHRLISASLMQDADVWRHAKRIAVLNLAFTLWVGLYAGVCAALGAWQCGLLTLSTFLPILVSLWALKRGASPVVCGSITCLGGWTMMTTIAVLSGGGVATPLLWYSVLPVLATMASGMVWGLAWTAACIVSIGLFALAATWGMPFPQQFSPRNLDVFGFTLIVGLVICQFVMAVVRVGVEQRALVALHEASFGPCRAHKKPATPGPSLRERQHPHPRSPPQVVGITVNLQTDRLHRCA